MGDFPQVETNIPTAPLPPPPEGGQAPGDAERGVQDAHAPTGSSVQNPEPQSDKGQGPGVRTLAQQAASLANLKKAQAAPKEKVYRKTEKRLAANSANLALGRARRQQEREQMVDRLDQAFPPLGQHVEIKPDVAADDADLPLYRIELPHGAARKPRRGWLVGWPCQGEERQGVNREAADYPALEKTARALLLRSRAIRHEVRREGRQVMRVLTEAAARVAAPSLLDLLTLARNLVLVLATSRLPDRLKWLKKMIEGLIIALLQKRYGDRTGEIFDLMAEVRRSSQVLKQMAESSRRVEAELRERQGLAPRQGRKRPDPAREPEAGVDPPAAGEPPSGPAQHQDGAGSAKRSPAGPDLPPTFEPFQALFRRAFDAPSSGPEAEMVNQLAQALWDHLHGFEQEMEERARQLDQALEQMAPPSLPHNAGDLQRRRARIIDLLDMTDAEHRLRLSPQIFRSHAVILLRTRYGAAPEIDALGHETE